MEKLTRPVIYDSHFTSQIIVGGSQQYLSTHFAGQREEPRVLSSSHCSLCIQRSPNWTKVCSESIKGFHENRVRSDKPCS